jgi:hypothetical protein
MFKLSLGPSGQFAARGNVCILPQDTTSLVSAMPIPLFRLRDEICVILVGSPDAPVTHDMLKKSLLLVDWWMYNPFRSEFAHFTCKDEVQSEFTQKSRGTYFPTRFTFWLRRI